jgi:nucleoside-diphosphate-sugar epimerase
MFLDHLKGKTIGILGLGYVGSNVYNYLDSIKDEYGIKIVGMDKGDLDIIKKQTFDYFINCAGNSGDFRQDIIGTIDSNISLLLFLLQNLKVKYSFVTLSSIRLYGFSENKDICFTEEDFEVKNHLNIDFIYNGTKKLHESIICNYSSKLSYNTSIVRLSNVVGKFDVLNDSTLIKKIMRYKIEGILMSTNENRNSKKDYIYIDDAVEGILRTLTLSENNEIYNIGYGKAYSIDEIADAINLKISYKEEKETSLYSSISINKAKEKIGFSPENNIIDVLNKQV